MAHYSRDLRQIEFLKTYAKTNPQAFADSISGWKAAARART